MKSFTTKIEKSFLFLCVLLLQKWSYCSSNNFIVDRIGKISSNDHGNKIDRKIIYRTFYQILEEKSMEKSIHFTLKKDKNNINMNSILKRRKRNVAEEIISGVYSRAKRNNERQRILLMLMRLTKSMPQSCSNCGSRLNDHNIRDCNIESLLLHKESSCPNGECIDKICSHQNKQSLLKDLRREITQLRHSIKLRRYRNRRKRIKAMLINRQRKMDPHSVFNGKQLLSY